MKVWENTLGWLSTLRLDGTVFVSPPPAPGCPCVTKPDTVISSAGGDVAVVDRTYVVFNSMLCWRAHWESNDNHTTGLHVSLPGVSPRAL
jgi:hypothetical protein